MMIFINEASKLDAAPREIWSGFVKILSAYAPHLGEELWEKLGNAATIAYEAWPPYDEELCKDDTRTVVVQVNGKIRDKFEAAAGTPKADLEARALKTQGAVKYLEGKTPLKIIIVPDKLVNIVVK
jgi:leucyl-tRNA synthetase